MATVVADDVAEALDLAWWVFREAAGDDLAGWDMAAASAGSSLQTREPGVQNRPFVRRCPDRPDV